MTADLPEFAIPDSGILKYKFEDDNDPSTAIDSFDNGNDGGITGATYVTDSKQGDLALDFDGQDDEVDTGVKGLTPPFSFAFWVKWDDPLAQDTALGNKASGNRDIYVRSFDGQYQLVWDAAGVNSKFGSIPADTWVHIGFVTDSSETIFYEDASSIFNGSGTSTQTDDSNNFILGYRGDDEYGDITLDNFSIYDKKLSQSEVTNHKDRGSI